MTKIKVTLELELDDVGCWVFGVNPNDEGELKEFYPEYLRVALIDEDECGLHQDLKAESVNIEIVEPCRLTAQDLHDAGYGDIEEDGIWPS